MPSPDRHLLPVLGLLLLCGCDPGGGASPETDGAAVDRGVAVDVGAADAGPADVGAEDIGAEDVGAEDAGTEDVGPEDAARDMAGPDMTPLDMAPLDMAPLDMSPPDAAPAPRSAPIISEFMASNRDTLLDETGGSPDWIELHNPGNTPYDLDGHHLTDDLDAPTRWRFPAVELPPQGYLIVFASGDDRRDPDAPLHTDFRLDADGETVALTGPAGDVIHAIEDWPGQATGVSYGYPMRIGRTALLDTGSPARAWIGPDPEGAERPDFDDGDWLPVTQGAGVVARGPGEPRPAGIYDLGPQLGLADVFWLRIPFAVPDGDDGADLELELTYDDGLTAWVDGELAHRDNDVLGATTDRPDSRALGRVRIPLPERAAGPGAITLRAVDAAAADGLFFAAARVVRPGVVIADAARHLPTPTPGAPNLIDARGLGPIVVDLDRHQPLLEGQPLRIGARVIETDAPVAAVRLHHRVMFGPEQTTEMLRVDDGRWLAELDTARVAPGQMIRWRVEAVDLEGRTAREPPFLDPLDSEEYVGTVVHQRIETNLPVYHWFVEDLAAAGTEAGTRGVLWYDGELYDNIEIDLHGQATTRFPKKSYNFDFNRDHRFRVRDDLERVKDFDLLTNYADKSKMRNTLSYGMFRDAGHAYHLVFPVRLHLNGEFFAVYEFVEDPDERWLRRMGYPEPLGSVYKCYDTLASVNGSEKKTFEEDGTADLQALIDGLGQPGDARRRFIYDHVDLAGMANFAAMLFITSGRDCCTKNYYAYRDHSTDMWWYLPWDIDLSLGRNWTGSYFDDRMFPENPLYEGQENRLIGSLYALPEFLEMYHRRVRTLADEQMQSSATPYEERYLENEADRWQAIIGADAALDNAAWDTWGQPQTMAEAVEIMKTEWLPGRRAYIYGQLAQRDGGGPVTTLIDGATGATRGRWFVPVDDGLGEAWTAPDFNDGGWDAGPLGIGYENGNGYQALIASEVRPAAVNPAATTVLVRIEFELDAPADLPVLRMKYDDGYVAYIDGVEVARRNLSPGPVSWNDSAAVHDDGAAVRFEDLPLDGLVLAPGRHVLAIRLVNAGADSSDFLLQPALVDGLPAVGDGPLPPAQPAEVDVTFEADEAAGAESFVALRNSEAFAVDISGWRLSGRGIEHVFRGGTVIPAGGQLYVVADVPAFRARAQGPRGGQGLFLQGNWRGELVEGPLDGLALEAP